MHRAMSEALYVCTGRIQAGTSLSHYGLGIDKYTHFTSPIRRYADVVVHKQLLLAIDNTASTPISAPPGFRPIQSQRGLPSIPDSSAISILRGEGLESKPLLRNSPMRTGPVTVDGAGAHPVDNSQSVDDVADALDRLQMNLSNGGVDSAKPGTVYGPNRVAYICDGLNKQNRMAKLSSMECQRLFLSLYFRKAVEVTKAVVTDLRVNGVLVYVPKYDLKAPVFIADRDGTVQIDPELVGLPANTGLDPTAGFAQPAARSRRFPAGRCVLDEQTGLRVDVPDAPRSFRVGVLDVLQVLIFSDFKDTKARVPSPRVHLVGSKGKGVSTSKNDGSVAINSSTVRYRGGSNSTVASAPTRQGALLTDQEPSMYGMLHSIERRPRLTASVRLGPVSKGEAGSTNRSVSSILPGRKVFSNFTNPDTLTAIQDSAANAASEAAAQRRAAAQASHEIKNEYQTTQTIERNVMVRAQKLAAVKRNARKGKGK